jgi:uncharacterized protein
MDPISQAKNLLEDLCEQIQVPGHSMEHFLAVWSHAKNAVENDRSDLNPKIKLEIELAALLHDADDKKLFKTTNYANARMILSSEKLAPAEIDIERVIQMIKLVSCSEGNTVTDCEKWMYIPRDSDRLEAIGQVGITRCLELADFYNQPMYVDSTPKSYTKEEVEANAKPDRFSAYQSGTKSLSTIDHFYDKLCHIGRKENLLSENNYVLKLAEERHNSMLNFVADFWCELKIVN